MVLACCSSSRFGTDRGEAARRAAQSLGNPGCWGPRAARQVRGGEAARGERAANTQRRRSRLPAAHGPELVART